MTGPRLTIGVGAVLSALFPTRGSAYWPNVKVQAEGILCDVSIPVRQATARMHIFTWMDLDDLWT